MQVFNTLLRRELGIYFGSLNGYVIVSTALLRVGVCFSDLVMRLNMEPTDMTLTEMFFSSWYFWLIMLLSAPLITMRSFASEKSSNTYETLMTTPVTDIQVLMSKFCGALSFHAIIWLPVMLSMLIIRFYVNDAKVVNIPAVFTTYFAILLVGALYMAIGCFSSSITRSQIVAGMISFTLGMGIFMLSYKALYIMPDTGPMLQLLTKLSLADYMNDSSRAILDTRPLIFIGSLTFFFLFATYHILQWRRWR